MAVFDLFQTILAFAALDLRVQPRAFMSSHEALAAVLNALVAPIIYCNRFY